MLLVQVAAVKVVAAAAALVQGEVVVQVERVAARVAAPVEIAAQAAAPVAMEPAMAPVDLIQADLQVTLAQETTTGLFRRPSKSSSAE